ncbi:MAG: hypothetical protein V2L15_04685 [Desulfobacteraceae bacterium]|jgi:1-deoxy-D-xylulose-5-phosphate reductoisomerase|nr:hypothetical protein [Desulfobacteraceae bacterium]
MPKRLVILGSTGSIGTSTLDVVARFPKHFSVEALTAGRNIQRLAEQVIAFGPKLVAVRDVEGANDLRRLLPPDLSVEIRHGEKGFCAARQSGGSGHGGGGHGGRRRPDADLGRH